MKLSLCDMGTVKDCHIDILVKRCKTISVLNLRKTSITNASMISIIKHLKNLEELNVNDNDIEYKNLLEVKALPNLKIFNCLYLYDFQEIDKLRGQLSNLIINRKTVSAAAPDLLVEPKDGFWNIRVKQTKLFQNNIISDAEI